MKKPLTALLLALVLLASLRTAGAAGPNGTISVDLYDNAAGRYQSVQADVVTLTLDGAPLSGDVPALVQAGRTLVPVRLVAEALAAEVLWVQETGQVILKRGTDTVVLTLGSSQALVNGQSLPLPDGVPATVVRYQGMDRTTVPLRFVSEQLGARVDWNQATYTALLTSPAGQAPARPALQVTDIQADANAQTVLITTNHKPDYQVLDLGDRVAVDIKGAALSSGFPGRITVDNELISAVRYADHGDDLYPDYAHTVRVVLDLRDGITYRENVTVEVRDNGVLLTTSLPDREEPDYIPTAPIDPQRSTIVIDPGHGGGRTGAQYEGIAEKAINLSVSQKLQAILGGYGYNVVMTRTGDTDVGLYERADIANAVEADLFVSLHSNAAPDYPDFSGIYTYYHPSSGRGARLAQAVQTPLTRLTGGIDRGIKSADFVVLRETEMCAVLVEMGFMTNHDELMDLIDDGYQDKLAQGIAEGIVTYLNGLR
ncbi:N-acetylmuramoyl-L-alanine amidase family protein [Intestinimonas massiliensis]|uniref:N-acetylmuramoyl-L-alanine amidase family protein n=1 Tax=Intestinimonas massiliensis (ex Afouda et al. 2020) TaxID=1673721 RepID=A0AAW5JQA1_9FIRM|nr:N-acetylmuramoyl-L-alanine amidase family protein [Intestinimonas massiliensis (ex Afouda et al. 2020)]MCQ4769594.1 N-acetylmuramoyl-L-alanine amidase family protein [Intestinimonas massiliensis (ex Afouda et al. 2020)]